MLKRKSLHILIVFLCLSSNLFYAQPQGVLKHFSHDENLSQSRILNIKQDSRGFIWLATFNGLIRYDGSNFRDFKIKKNEFSTLKSNRIYNFEFDESGRIWIELENSEIYYFDTRTLEFHHPLERGREQTNKTSFKRFEIMSSGKVWLFPENENYIVIYNSEDQIKKIGLDTIDISSNDIHDVFEDTSGQTWFLTKAGLCKFNNGEIVPDYFFFNASETSRKSLLFTSVMETKEEIWFGGLKGKLVRYAKKANTFLDFKLNIKGDIVRIETITDDSVLIFTKDNGFYSYQIKTNELIAYNRNTLSGFPKDDIVYLGLTNGKELWFEGDRPGVCQFNFRTKKLSHLKVSSTDLAAKGINRKIFMLTAPDGTVWIQPNDGALSYWNSKTNKLHSIAECIKGQRKDVSDIMHTAMFDKSGNLWFCSLKQGLDLLSFNNNFSALNLDLPGESLKHNVRSLMEDNKGNLWVASRSKKITLLDSQKKVIGRLGVDGTLSENSQGWGAGIYHMMQDIKGNIWLGTRGNGLFCLSPTKRPFNYKVQHYKYDEANRYSLSSNHIYNIFQSSTGVIYIATWGGGINIIQSNTKERRFINYRNELNNYPIKKADRVRLITENNDNEIFFITPNELFSFSEKNKKDFVNYSEVSGTDILDLLVTSNNQLVIATNGRGVLLVDFKDDKVVNVYCPLEDIVGFPIEGVMSIQDDDFGNIWLMGENKVVRYNYKDKAVETFPELSSIMGAGIISEATKFQLKNGEIVIGYSNGALYFNPKNIKPLEFKPHLSISSFTVYNKELHEINPDAEKNSDMLEEVTLKHDQNFFRIHLSVLDYIKKENIVYRYKLEGIEEQWNYFKGAQSINYTNLSQGEYNLLISSTNSHNLWVDNERSIGITILPSIWRTNIAYMCYVVLAIILFFLVQRTIMTILKLRNDVSMEKQMAELKLKFFTDISHEIRTPLTMITAPVEKMLTDEKVSDSVKKQLKTIERNSNKLLSLVNQILDLRRIQNRKLFVKEIDLGRFTITACEDFKALSLQTNISLKIKNINDKCLVWADVESMEKVFVNLISNAFKYCKAGDVIEVSVEETEKQVELKIKDNGPGISLEVQTKLFQRFFNYNVNPSNPSTGIGLSIVKGLLDKHGATISVNSEEGKGTCFQLSFLKGYEHFIDDIDIAFENVNNNITAIEESVKNKTVIVLPEEEVTVDKKVGLIVEDDQELRAFMVSILEKDYIIHEAENGILGFEKAKKLLPDFIVSDIMMPKMDGIEMLKLIRNSADLSHMPIVLLSAKTSIESKLEGMEYGADEYLTKPFNVAYLRARVKNILEQRKRLQNLYSGGNVKEISVEEETLQISNQDHEFMIKVIELVENNMMKTDFSVEELGGLMNMSRASFFNKLKALSGVSPVKFIRDMKLNKAAKLIKTEGFLIKEVCFQVGFSDLKYFGKCFKEKFNYTPSDYRRLHR